MRQNLAGRGCFPTGVAYPGIAHLLGDPTSGTVVEFAPEMRVDALPLVCIDTETTGTQAESDRIVELACVTLCGREVGSRRSWLINPEMPIPPGATAVHGISDADVRERPVFRDLVAEIAETMQGAVPLAYNAGFDRSFIFAELRRAGVELATPPPAFRDEVVWLDPFAWAWALIAKGEFRGKNKLTLTAISERLNVTLEQAHRATGDAEAAGRVFAELSSRDDFPGTYATLVREQRVIERRIDEARARFRR